MYRSVIVLLVPWFGLLPLAPGQTTWETRNNGLASLLVVALTIDPASPDVAYCTARGHGIQRTLDGGATWHKHGSGIPNWGPPYGHILHHGVAISTSDSNVLWAAAADIAVHPNLGYIYKSENGGATWRRSSNNTTVAGWSGVAGIVQVPGDPSHLYAGTVVSGAEGGVFESTDGGESWQYIAGSTIADDGGIANDVWPIVIDPVNPLRLYAGTPHQSLFISDDGGRMWRNVSPGVLGEDRQVNAITLNPADLDEVWIRHTDGAFRSDDGGDTWNNVSGLFGGGNFTQLAFHPGVPEVAYALVDDEIWRSEDSGGTWQRRTDGIPFPRCMAVHPADPDTLFVGTYGRGLYKSTNGALTLLPANNGMPVTATVDIDVLAADPANRKRLYCHLRGNGVYRSDDAGRNWRFLHPLYGYFLYDLVVDPAAPDRLYAARDGLWRSLDAGATWQTVIDPEGATEVRGVALDPQLSSVVWAIDCPYEDPNARVLRSINTGNDWETRGRPGDPPYDQYSDIAVDPFDRNTVLIAGSPKWNAWMDWGWLHRTTDAGQSWTRVREGLMQPGWEVVSGYWYSSSTGRFVQSTLNGGGKRCTVAGAVLGDGTFEARLRVTAVEVSNDNWCGLVVGLPAPRSDWTTGVLVYMRRNGAVGCWQSGSVVFEVTGAVANAAAFQRIRIETAGDTYDVYLNDGYLGSFEDEANAFGPGYVGLACNRTQGEFDDVIVRGSATFEDHFDVPWTSGHALGQVAFDRHQPGLVYVRDGKTIWRSTDHGATWERMATASGNNSYYIMVPSAHHPGRLYAAQGYYWSSTFDIGYYQDGGPFTKVGGSRSKIIYSIAEDAARDDVLYAAETETGVLVYEPERIPALLSTH